MNKNHITALACIVITIVCGVSIYLTQFAERVPHQTLHLGIGRAMAQETAKLVHPQGKIVIVDMELSKAPELKVQIREFEKTLQKLGNFDVHRKTLDTEDKAKYAAGAGLSARRFFRLLKNNETADVIVSFVGAPRLDSDDIPPSDLKKTPKFLAEVRAPEKLKSLFEKKLIQTAIVSRYEFPAPPQKPRTPEEWFNNRFQIVTAKEAETLP